MPMFKRKLTTRLITLSAVVVTSLILWVVAPWVHNSFMPSIGLGLPWDFALVIMLAFALSSALTLWITRLLRSASIEVEWTKSNNNMPRSKVAQEVREVAPYLQVMSQQLEGAIKETETGVLGLINSLNSIHGVADTQLHRINASGESGAALSTALEEKVLVDKQLGMILQMFVDKQHADIDVNLGRIRRLQEVKGLDALVSEISQVAKLTNILAINAAVEAARAGDAGRGFAVLAAEIRQLSNRTAEAAVNISRKISAATEGIDEELQNATAVDERTSATGSMQQVIHDVDNMQQRFSSASNTLLQIINGVKTGHQEIVVQLSDALGQIQFQDVIRQRVEHVQKALEELNDHLQSMADQLLDKPWDPASMLSLRERLDQQVASYVMKSQVDTHQNVTGKVVAKSAERPSIELF